MCCDFFPVTSPVAKKLLAERAASVHLDGGKVDAKCSHVECDGDIFSNLRKGKVIMA